MIDGILAYDNNILNYPRSSGESAAYYQSMCHGRKSFYDSLNEQYVIDIHEPFETTAGGSVFFNGFYLPLASSLNSIYAGQGRARAKVLVNNYYPGAAGRKLYFLISTYSVGGLKVIFSQELSDGLEFDFDVPFNQADKPGEPSTMYFHVSANPSGPSSPWTSSLKNLTRGTLSISPSGRPVVPVEDAANISTGIFDDLSVARAVSYLNPLNVEDYPSNSILQTPGGLYLSTELPTPSVQIDSENNRFTFTMKKSTVVTPERVYLPSMVLRLPKLPAGVSTRTIRGTLKARHGTNPSETFSFMLFRPQDRKVINYRVCPNYGASIPIHFEIGPEAQTVILGIMASTTTGTHPLHVMNDDKVDYNYEFTPDIQIAGLEKRIAYVSGPSEKVALLQRVLQNYDLNHNEFRNAVLKEAEILKQESLTWSENQILSLIDANGNAVEYMPKGKFTTDLSESADSKVDMRGDIASGVITLAQDVSMVDDRQLVHLAYVVDKVMAGQEVLRLTAGTCVDITDSIVSVERSLYNGERAIEAQIQGNASGVSSVTLEVPLETGLRADQVRWQVVDGELNLVDASYVYNGQQVTVTVSGISDDETFLVSGFA